LKKIFAILLSLALVVSLGAITAAPVAAVTQPSISPTSALYDLDAPAQVTTTITWGGAATLANIFEVGGAALAKDTNWFQYSDLVVIDEDWLDDALTYIGDSVTLLFVFDVGVATLTITATGTSPAVSPSSATWVYGSSDAVSTIMIWGPATPPLTSVNFGALVEHTDWEQFGNLLVIYASCLNNPAKSGIDGVGDYTTLLLSFSTGIAAFTIVATGASPTISPASTSWQVGSTDVVTTTITFNSAIALSDVTESGGSIAGRYTIFDTLLVIHDDYLDDELGSEGDTLALVLEFDSGAFTCILTITATGVDVPSISPASAKYCVGSGDNVTTTVTLAGGATGIDSIVDVTSVTVPTSLAAGTDYLLSGNTLHIAGGPTVTQWTGWGGLEGSLDCYLRGARILRITFNDVANTQVDFTVSSDGTCCEAPGLSSTALTYDLDLAKSSSYLYDPIYAYVVALVTWGDAANITKVTDNSCVGNPTCSPLVFAVAPTICASCNCTLKGASAYETGDYYAPYYAPYASYLLQIYKATYLSVPCSASGAGADLQEIGDDVKLTVYWSPSNPLSCMNYPTKYYPDRFAPTSVTITAVGTSGSISPSSGEFDIDDPGNVTAEIVWGPHAADVVGITCGLETLDDGTDFTFEATTAPAGEERDNSKLIIMSEWLEGKLENVGDTIVLNVEFDTGEDGKLTIKAAGTPLCFIATAAGADAPQLDILREFRDEVMRPNKLGAELVSLYYETSPPIAEFISQSGALKAAVKVGLIDPIAAILNLCHGLWS